MSKNNLALCQKIGYDVIKKYDAMSLSKTTTKEIKSKKTRDLVYQHNKLIEATYRMSLPTKRLFLILLSLVNPKAQNKDLRMTIHAKDFANACGIDVDSAYPQLVAAADDLVGSKIRTHDPKTKTREVYVISGYANYHDGSGFIECDLYPKILPLIQQFRGNFTQFKLAESIQFKRFYSIRIYELLMAKDNDKMGRKLKIKVEEFKIILDINHLPTYENFSAVNRRIIQPSLKEIQAKTGLIIDLKLQRYGRRISYIIFEFERNKQKDMFK